jgi:phosphatidylglycerophosphate synthase
MRPHEQPGWARARAIAHALSMMAASVAAVATGQPLWFGAAGAAAIALWVVVVDRPWSRGELGTLANLLTIARVVGCACLPAVFPHMSALQFTAVLVGLIAMDAVDGAVARRTGRMTAFGGRLDLEADAFLTLMMCVLLRQAGLVGSWILIAGLWRYVYSALVAAFPTRGEEPRSRLGRYVAAVLMLSLSGSFLLGPRWAPLAAGLGTALVSYSFIHSLVWSYRPASGRR